MSRPEDPLGGESHLTSQSREQMSDQVNQEEIARRRASDAQAIRNAQAQIENAINDIRSHSNRQSFAPLPKLLPAANLRLPRQAANRPPTTSSSPLDDPFAGVKRRLPSNLDPEIVPMPPPQGSRRLGPILIRSSLIIGFAAIVAFGITMFSSFRPDGRSSKTSNDTSHDGASIGRTSHEPGGDARPSLAVEDQQAFANEPIWLGVVATPAISSGALSLRGLARGTRLSAGVALDEDGWELPLRDFDGAYVYAPPDFVGVMNATIALLSPSKKVMDSRPMRLQWIAKGDSLQPLSNRELDSGNASVIPKEGIDPGTVSPAAAKPIDPQEAVALMARGRELLRNGDVASAQLAFQRLAEVGEADAALALATTYDPRYLAEHRLVGIIGDEAKARAWYQRAKELRPTNTK
jgi:hypothetical protein